MSIPPNKRATMSLYSSAADAYSHRVRIVMSEKSITYDLLEIAGGSKNNEEVLQLNPYGTLPLLIDRELVLYQSEIIMEYLDERFPHPSLLPAYPVARARCRLMVYRVNRDWYSLMDKILAAKDHQGNSETHIETEEVINSRKELREGLTSIAPIFSEMPYFLSEEFSLIDCCMAPLLWRLPALGITLPEQAQSVLGYAERLFNRSAFAASLSEEEERMRP